MQRLTSLLIWAGVILLTLLWFPFLLLIRFTDRTETRYRTGRWFRRLGKAITRINPNWKITIEGESEINDRRPYVMVSNHQSNGDIPVISNLPWEMKWIAKKQLFSLPFVGWMMKLAGDIPVKRGSIGQVGMMKRAMFYLDRRISVIIFPEGTRSRDGRLTRFSKGAFELAIKKQVSILPIVVEGTHGCLPKNSWVFEPDVHVRLQILEPVSTDGMGLEDADELKERVRLRMVEALMEVRGEPAREVDAMAG